MIRMTNFISREAAAIGTAIALVAALFIVSVGLASALVSSTLDPGDSGADVTELQAFLKLDASVYPEGLVTGYYGSLTVAAVQRFQCKQGIVCSGDPASTGYGRVGPLTLAKIQSLQGGVSLPPISPPASGADVNAPVLSRPSVATTSNSAVIHWTTNEPAQSWVLYSTVVPALSASVYASLANIADATLDMSSDVTITGLSPNTTYHFILQSVDLSGNVQYGIDHSFRTNP